MSKMNLLLIMALSLCLGLVTQPERGAAQHAPARHAPAPADTHFEGIIRYSMQFEGKDLSPEIKSMVPRAFTIYLKNARSRMEMETSVSEVTVLGDNRDNSAVTLMDIMGKKLAIKTDSAQLNGMLQRFGDYKIEYTGGKKKILGYDCRKALVIRNDDADTSEVWYTKELPAVYPTVSQFLPKGNWFPMEVHAAQKGVKTVLTVQAIKERPLADSLFNIPAGYQIMEQ